MPRIRILLSLLAVACALAVVLLEPAPSRADDGTTPAPPVPPVPSTDPLEPQLPTVKARTAPKRTPQLHLPLGKRVVGFARHLIGVRYVYGGSSPRSGFDCSGLVRYVYGHFGVTLPHSSFAQFGLGRRVSRSSLRPGDLVFFDGLGHVGMYIGNGRFIHAPHAGTRVRIETLAGWYGARFSGARRLRSA
jgi:cell wall-associated NlpC family hydrolase